jgi:hypothetical protein
MEINSYKFLPHLQLEIRFIFLYLRKDFLVPVGTKILYDSYTKDSNNPLPLLQSNLVQTVHVELTYWPMMVKYFN